MTAINDPLGLTIKQRQVFGEYIIGQRAKGRINLPMPELAIVLDVIKAIASDDSEPTPEMMIEHLNKQIQTLLIENEKLRDEVSYWKHRS